MSTSKTVRSHLRGLEVLEALNRHNYATAAEICREVNLPRPTVHRLLGTLIEAGYVEKDPESDVFCLCSKVRKISEGFDENARLIEIAKPYIREFSSSVCWPSYLFQLDGQVMVTRAIARTPRAFSYPRIGQRFDVLASAPGRAFLASLEYEERNDWMVSCGAPQTPDPSKFHGMIRDAGLLGCGFRDGGIVPKTTSIALPIHGKTSAVAYWTIVFMRSAVSVNKAIDTYLPHAITVTQEIEKRLSAP